MQHFLLVIFQFQSTPSRRGRRKRRRNSYRKRYFNPLPQEEGDLDIDKLRKATEKLFQSTPSRRGRRADGGVVSAAQKISIHSLKKRETDRIEKYIGAVQISIHSLKKRETRVPVLQG